MAQSTAENPEGKDDQAFTVQALTIEEALDLQVPDAEAEH